MHGPGHTPTGQGCGLILSQFWDSSFSLPQYRTDQSTYRPYSAKSISLELLFIRLAFAAHRYGGITEANMTVAIYNEVALRKMGEPC